MSLCLGTSLQIVPSGNLPVLTKKNGGKLVIINLQPTKHDKKAHLKINTFVDDVIRGVCMELGIIVPDFKGPSVLLKSIHTRQEESDLNVVVADETLECKTPIKPIEMMVKTEPDDVKVGVKSDSASMANIKTETADKVKDEVKSASDIVKSDSVVKSEQCQSIKQEEIEDTSESKKAKTKPHAELATSIEAETETKHKPRPDPAHSHECSGSHNNSTKTIEEIDRNEPNTIAASDTQKYKAESEAETNLLKTCSESKESVKKLANDINTSAKRCGIEEIESDTDVKRAKMEECIVLA